MQQIPHILYVNESTTAVFGTNSINLNEHIGKNVTVGFCPQPLCGNIKFLELGNRPVQGDLPYTSPRKSSAIGTRFVLFAGLF